MKGDIHGYMKKLQWAITKLGKSNITENNKKLIFEFHNMCFAERISAARIERYIMLLRQMAEILNKDYNCADKSDIMNIIRVLETRDYTEWTKQFYRVALKKFFRFVRNTKTDPEEVAWLKTSIKNEGRKLPEELLTIEEVKSIIEAAKNPRDKAFFAMLYETGCRIGEIATLQNKNVAFDKYGAQLTVDGKTGMRRVRIISSSPYLATWMAQHPLRDDPNAPVWYNFNFVNTCVPVHYSLLCTILKKTAKRAGIKKRIYPHLFRHSRATHLATHLTEAQMKQYFGWVQSSKMASVYVHLSGRDVDNALLKLNGIVPDEADIKKENEVLKPKDCLRCGTVNTATSKFCTKCGIGLDLRTVLDVEEKRKNADLAMNELFKDPEVMALLQKKLEHSQVSVVNA